MTIYFLSSNHNKIKEVETILTTKKIQVKPIGQKINEIQSENMKNIAEDKALKAYKLIGRPILVEQTGLLIEKFENLPGGLTQIFWDSLEADKFSEFFSKNEETVAIAKTVLAYCDGKKVYTFDGEIKGNIIYPPKGNREFQWDCVFRPFGYDQTFAEMGAKKNEISMRKIALEKLKIFLEEEYEY